MHEFLVQMKICDLPAKTIKKIIESAIYYYMEEGLVNAFPEVDALPHYEWD